ncbi:hypothetical protein [Streptomyces sp. cg40]|uniref:hypothetical protein n=1 Tax=Streptomyces sp. cg40 TaxID=3419764 RepID=UPI003D023036
MEEQAPDIQAQDLVVEEERKPVVFAVHIDPVLREQIEGLRGITEQSVNDVGGGPQRLGGKNTGR